MTRLGFALSMVVLVLAASWAYHVNYRTKQALGRIDKLRAEIAAEREASEVLGVEWAYLNAPDRLTRLVLLNNNRLRLVPMEPQNFGDVAVVPYRSVEARRPSPKPPPSVAIVPGVETVEPHAATFMTAPMPVPRPVDWRRP